MPQFIYWIPLVHVLAFVINILFGRLVKKNASVISIAMSLFSCAIALPICWKITQGGAYYYAADWLPLGGLSSIKIGCYIDALSATLLFVVTFIGTLIQIYSVGYMDHEPRFSRFFAYLSLFMAAMLTLVISNNYLLFFMAWEIMGLCSYLLIGFYFEKDSAAEACRKAFLTTRVGDVGFFLGILTLFTISGTLEFPTLAHQSLNHVLLPVAAALIFCGTIGKSAQIPLHVWLPDAMEGPTPVSALIHAATMVAAGVYLLSRSLLIFHFAGSIYPLVITVGTTTAFMAACIALTATDIKKVLAYSTISQLGFMVTAFGLGGFQASTFHLMTHAFFKALLFLGAGSVIHGAGTQDLREMGGLFGKMKHTATTFVIGALAIAGIPPLSGFWSKDEILTQAYHSHYPAVFWILILTAFMTSFYMFRLVFLAFFGKTRNPKIHAHESPATMTGPLWVLAMGAIFMGLPGSPLMGHWFQNFLSGSQAHHGEHELDFFVMACSIAAGVLGIFFSGAIYLKKPFLSEAIAHRFSFFYRLFSNQFYFDEFYTTLIIRPFKAAAQSLFTFDQKVVDGVVNQAGTATLETSRIKQWIDQYIIDGLVNLCGWVTQILSAIVRKVQTGFVQHYIFMVFLSVILLICFRIR